ncbi:hypothetical protein I6E43_05910 [Fusobacterium varium]|nr:hypothetical protein [Fusobacterium varium]
MKKILIFILYFCLFLSIIASKASDIEKKGDEHKRMENITEFGLTINNIYYPIPSTLKQFLDKGWIISTQTPHLLPLVSEDYYEVRSNFSLSKDSKGIYPGGSIIRLLEKNETLLEVTIANQVDSEKDKNFQEITDGTITSITIFYDSSQTSIKLNDMELNRLSQESLLVSYPRSDGWTHAPTNYRNHPEFGVSTDYYITQHLNNYNRSISVYFNLENTAFGITILNEMPLKFYSK